MKRTYKPIKVMKGSNGSWLIKMRYFKNDVSCIVKDASAIEDFMCDENERCPIDGRTFRKARGYDYLLNQIRKEYANRTRNHEQDGDSTGRNR